MRIVIFVSPDIEFKNHKIILDMLSYKPIKNLLIYFTATTSEFSKYRHIKYIRRIDYYSYENTYKIYNKFDGLIYHQNFLLFVFQINSFF